MKKLLLLFTFTCLISCSSENNESNENEESDPNTGIVEEHVSSIYPIVGDYV